MLQLHYHSVESTKKLVIYLCYPPILHDINTPRNKVTSMPSLPKTTAHWWEKEINFICLNIGLSCMQANIKEIPDCNVLFAMFIVHLRNSFLLATQR